MLGVDILIGQKSTFRFPNQLFVDTERRLGSKVNQENSGE